MSARVYHSFLADPIQTNLSRYSLGGTRYASDTLSILLANVCTSVQAAGLYEIEKSFEKTNELPMS